MIDKDTPHYTSMESSRIPSDPMHNALTKKQNIAHTHTRRIYAELSESVVFISVTGNTSGRIYEDCLCLIFLHVNREASASVGELSEVMRVTIPLD